jgi:hypothetical protein
MARHASSRVHGFPWKRVYRAATLETNNARLEKRIQIAEATLLARLIDLEGLRENELEIRAIENAIRTLWTIRWRRLDRAA